MKYRVINQRDDTRANITEFSAKNNKEALSKFEKDYVFNKNYDWDYLSFYRIDQEEKTTHLKSR